jgi:glyoxylase-like metal-dependent hydrolase (beta-lactamase superfamily II)
MKGVTMKNLASITFIAAFLAAASPARAAAPLKCEVYVSDSGSFCVTSTLIYGETEAFLVDVQYHKSDAVKFADRVAATGRKLKAIFISHPHDDHYMCIGVWREKFPNTPVYMAPACLKEFLRSSKRYYNGQKSYIPAETPDSLPTPEALPTTHFTIDGERVEIVPDRQGDEWVPSNSYVWIPSTRTIVAGDIVFNGVHMWLANSTEKSRKGWLKTLDRLSALHPGVVIAGHKNESAAPDGPDVIQMNREYVKTFERLAGKATGSDDLVAKMSDAFPSLRLKNILFRAARITIPD